MSNSKKRCKHCREYVKTSEGIQYPSVFLCSEQCTIRYAIAESDKKKEKARRNIEKKNRAALKELDKRSLRWQHKQTQKVFNKLRVLQEKLWFQDRGLEPVCISCGKVNMDWCCGHFKTVGSQSILRYDIRNTYLQCNRYCNMGLSGNIHGNKNTRGYIQGLYDRFGDEEAKPIIDYCETTTSVPTWTWEDLERMRANYSKQCRELLPKLKL